MIRILVIDDEKDIRESLKGVLSDEGYDVLLAESGEEGLKNVREDAPDLILLDIWMEGMDGVETLKKIKEDNVHIPVIMISGHANIETAVTTTKLGAYDFIEKPLSLDKVCLTVEHALEKERLVEENRNLRNEIASEYEIIGNTKIMDNLKKDIEKIAPSNAWVLITGDNGTGKELVARNIHLKSLRKENSFIAVNCAAIPEELIESELFGHEKGAFTGAIGRKKGKFDLAHNGTLFLDEIADMSLMTQAKVLRILQEQTFERVGGTEQISVDVRVVAATNKDLQKEIAEGNFREDLYYRLNVIPIVVPSLKERKEDIEIFVNYFIEMYCKNSGKKPLKISKDALKTLSAYNWPGNIRELKNLIERLVILSSSDEITLDDLPVNISGSVKGDASMEIFKGNLKTAKNEFEKQYIINKIKENNNNIAKTAENIGIERSHLYRKIKTYKIDV